MSTIPSTLYAFRELLQASFTEEKSGNKILKEEENAGKSLKAYLIESHRDIFEIRIPGYSEWKRYPDSHKWFYSFDLDNNANYFIVDTSSSRIFIFYSLIDVKYADSLIEKTVKSTRGLDYCWLSRGLLESFHKLSGWYEKGIGLRYKNALADSDDRATLSLKAWYGSNRLMGWEKFIENAKDTVTITSIRWKKIVEGDTRITSEWYNYGKVTITASEDIDETLLIITHMARKYENMLVEATKLRDGSHGAFEFNFTQKIDLQAFSTAVGMGKADFNLWLTEVYSEPGFRRFRGVDMHTWDVIFFDLAEDYAYLTIPGNGCVNAAPRIATIQGEYTTGKTQIYFNGDEIFV